MTEAKPDLGDSLDIPDRLVDAILAALDRPLDSRNRTLRDLERAFPQFEEQIQGFVKRSERLGSSNRSVIRVGGDRDDAAGVGPEQIRSYQVLDKIGEGGMGTVYVAEQREPVRRRVALKIIKAGLDSEEVLARFDVERQALALMDHPNIARVLDAGTTDEGQPYFVMELVRGEPINAYCDKNRLGIRERIALFRQVCLAVQHAHHKGIIHRDLKPGNVLVAMTDGEPVVKIIDFGLARATDRQLTERVLYTEYGRILGTPEYMSPEQAEMSPIEIDTRTDVYSLGVMLYELLVGELPFDPLELRKAGYSEIQRRIREVEPPLPSSRLSTLDAKSSSDHALKRHLETRTLIRKLRGDLDWITMRALEKDPTRRYQTPMGLVLDLDRYLNHEPVQAGPPSLGYRASKFVRKYRAQVVAAALVLLALLIGLVATFVQWQEARAARERSDRFSDALAFVSLEVDLDRAERQAEAALPAWPENLPALEAWLDRWRSIETRIREFPRKLESATRDFAPDSVQGSALEAVDRDFANLSARWVEVRDAVSEARAWASTIRTRSIDEHREAWEAASSRLRDDPRFGDAFDLAPQVGLVPLGRDPRSGLEEFGHLASGALPVRGRSGELGWDGRSGVIFVLVPGGTFEMGAGPDTAFAHERETPQHAVVVPAFLVSKFELTAGQWMRLAKAAAPPNALWAEDQLAPYAESGERLTCPVENVSWHDCRALLRRHGLDLPTEAQWEYACRGATDPSWAWFCGAEPDSLLDPSGTPCFANLKDDDDYDDGCAFYAPVGSFDPNPFGLHDVYGNVHEWCVDVFQRYEAPYPSGDQPIETVFDGQADMRVVRGGGYNTPYWAFARSSGRGDFGPANRTNWLGCRPVRRVLEHAR